MNLALDIAEAVRPVFPAYCDFIADRIHRALQSSVATAEHGALLTATTRVRSDLHPQGGYLLTTKKTILVADRNGRAYRVTVEEVPASEGV